MRVPRAVFALLATGLLLAPVAAADTEVGLIDLLGPSLGALDGALLDLGDAVAPTPAAPLLLPAIDLGRLVVAVLRATAQATVLGAADGDAGHEVGAPDEVGAVMQETVVVDGVGVPGQTVSVPGRRIDVSTPGVERTVATPPIGLPAQRIPIPGREVPVDAPAVGLPAVTIQTPPIVVVTPPVATPPVRVAAPAVSVGPQEAHLDLSGADLTVQELRGTIYAGPVAVPYSVGPATVGQALLPAEVPRTYDAATPGADVLPATVLVDEPAREVLAAQRAEAPAQTVPVTEGQELFPGAHVGTVEVPGQRVDTPGVAVLPAQEVPVSVPSRQLAVLDVSGQSVATPPVQVNEEQVVLPAADHRLDPFGEAGDVGYVGYGRGDDSSLYPYACTAVVGCAQTRPLLRPYVAYADGLLGLAADLVNGPVVVRP